MRRLQYDAPSQAVRNLITNPELVADISDKVLNRNLSTNPGFETSGGTNILNTNLITNPGFEASTGTTSVWTNNALNPSFESVNGPATMYTNLATNPSFEGVAAGTSVVRKNLAWNTASQGVINSYLTFSRMSGASGGDCIVGTITDANPSDGAQRFEIQHVDPRPSVEIGTPITISSNMKSTVPDALIKIYAIFVGDDGSSQTLSTPTNAYKPILSSGYTRVYETFVSPKKGKVWFQFALAGTGARSVGQTMTIKDILIEQTDQLRPFFDGATPDSSGWDYGWTGIANASVSSAKSATVDVFKNLAPNPRMVASDGLFSIRRNLVGDPRAVNAFPGYGSQTITTTAISGHPVGITTANRVVGTGGASAGITILTNVQPSTTYSMSAWVFHESVDPSSQNQAFAHSGVTSQASYPAVQGAWARYSWTYTTDSNAVQNPFGFRLGGTPSSSASYLITGIMVEPVMKSEDYFDGSTPLALRTNLVPNPTAVTSAAWFTANTVPVSFSVNNSGGPVGTPYARSTVTGTATGTGYFAVAHGSVTPSQWAPATPGQTYTISAYVRATMVNYQQPLIRLRWKLASGVTIKDEPFVTATGTSSGQWVRLSATGVAPANTSYVELMAGYINLDQSTLVVGDTLDVSAFMMEQSSVLGTYFDGNTAPSAPVAYGWRGAANTSLAYAYSTDLTYMWNGPTNGSESLMRANSVADYFRSGSDSGGAQIITEGSSKILRYIYKSEINAIAVNSTAMSNQASMLDKVYTVSARVRSSVNLSAVRVRLNGANGPSVNLVAGQWQTLTFTTTYAGSGYTGVWSPAIGSGNYGQYIDVADFMVVEGTYTGPYFDGSKPSSGDFIYTWAGTPDNSASVCQGAKTVVTGTARVAQVYSFDWASTGSSSVRLINNTADPVNNNDSYIEPFPWTSFKVNTKYTVKVKVRKTAPLGGTLSLNGYSGIFWHFNGGEVAGRVNGTNTAGVQELTATFTTPASMAAYNTFRLYNGSTMGSGDVWFDDLLIFEGEYNGPFFDGNTANTSDFTYVWGGLPNASISVQQGISVFDSTSVQSYENFAVQSSEWSTTSGGKSIRVIPRLTTSNNTWVAPGGDANAFRLGMAAGKTYTVMVKVRIAAPQTGALNSVARGLRVLREGWASFASASAPNIAGVHDIRLTFTVPTDATMAYIRLYNGAAANGGDVWFDDFLLVEGTYNGPYFDGSRPSVQNLAPNPSFETGVTSWNSAANATVTTTTAVKRSGLQSALATTTASGTGVALVSTGSASAIPAVAGATYTFSAYVKGGGSVASTRDAFVIVYFRNAAGSVISAGIQGAYTPVGNSDWVRVSVTATAPADTVKVQMNVNLYANTVVLGDIVYVDDILIEQGSALNPYFEGQGDFTYVWNGTANASTSSQRANTIQSWSFATNAVTYQNTVMPSKFGTKTGAVVTKGYSGDGIYFGDVDATSGTTYVFSVWVYATSVHRFDGVLRWKDSTGTTIYDATYEVSSTITVGQWSKVFIVATAPANTVKVQPMWRIYAVHVPTTFFVDGAVLTKSSIDYPYFDGSNAISQNLCTNPSFATNLNGYTAVSSSLVRVTDRGDGHACEITQTIASSSRQSPVYLFPTTQSPDTYTVSVDASTTAPELASIKLWMYDTVSASAASNSVTLSLVKDGSFARYSGVLIATKSFDRLYIDLLGTAIPVGTKAWIDRLLIEKGTSVVNRYFEGTGDFTYAWTGGANVSTSTISAPTITGNSGYQNVNGSSSSKVYQTAYGINGKSAVVYKNGGHAFVDLTLSGLTENTSYTISFDALTSASLVTTVDRGPTGSNYYPLNKTVTPNVVTRVSRTITTGVGETGRKISLAGWENGTIPDGTSAILDNVSIVQGSIALPYFDGSTPDTVDYNYLWDGAVNDSTSSQRVMNIKGTWFGQRAAMYSSAVQPFSGSHKAKGVVTEIGYFPRLVSNVYPVVPGRRYTAFAKMKCSSQPVQIAMAWVQTSGSSTSDIYQAASNGNWVRPSVTQIAPSDATHVQLYMGVPNSTALGTEFEIDSILLTDRVYDGPFGSGDSYGWEWEGEPHASSSKGYPVGLMQLAGKPLFVGALPGPYVLTDIDPAKNPTLDPTAPRTIYSIVDNLSDIPTNGIYNVYVYGVDSLNDTTPNTTLTVRQESSGDGTVNHFKSRRTGGGGPIAYNVPSKGRQVLISGLNENGRLFSAVNKGALAVDDVVIGSLPHERISIAGNSTYHQHIVTYIYPGVHSSAVRAEMVKLLADQYNIPGLG